MSSGVGALRSHSLVLCETPFAEQESQEEDACFIEAEAALKGCEPGCDPSTKRDPLGALLPSRSKLSMAHALSCAQNERKMRAGLACMRWLPDSSPPLPEAL